MLEIREGIFQSNERLLTTLYIQPDFRYTCIYILFVPLGMQKRTIHKVVFSCVLDPTTLLV